MDRILVVSQVAVPFLRNAARLRRSLLTGDIGADRIEYVLNRYSGDHELIKPEEAEKHFGRKIYSIIPNDYRRVTTSRDLGHPILASAPSSPARLAIQELARRLVAEASGQPPSAPQKPPRRGLLGLFRRTARTGAPAAVASPTA